VRPESNPPQPHLRRAPRGTEHPSRIRGRKGYWPGAPRCLNGAPPRPAPHVPIWGWLPTAVQELWSPGSGGAGRVVLTPMAGAWIQVDRAWEIRPRWEWVPQTLLLPLIHLPHPGHSDLRRGPEHGGPPAVLSFMGDFEQDGEWVSPGLYYPTPKSPRRRNT
jgi:hypothetical protein